MNQKVSTVVGTLIIIIMVLTAGAFLFKVVNFDMQSWYQPITTKMKKKPAQKACTMEAQLCPDGSYVGRSGPNCEFSPCPDESAINTSDWKTYRNEKYGFALTFPETWKGYTVKNRTLDWGSDGTSDSIDFGFSEQNDGLFNVSFHNKKQYDSISSSGVPFSQKLGENNGYIIVWNQAQYAANSNLERRMEEISDIIKSFKLIN